MSVYISIGNSDDKLTQGEWSQFVDAVQAGVKAYASVTHGKWMSLPHAPWQNACWCIEVSESAALHLRTLLALLARQFRQDSIAWAVAQTQFIAPASE